MTSKAHVYRTADCFEKYWRGKLIDQTPFDPEAWDGEMPTVSEFVANKHASRLNCVRYNDEPCFWPESCPKYGCQEETLVGPLKPTMGGLAELITSGDPYQRLDLTDNPNSENSKPTNPKDAIGSDKLPLHLWPETATALGCLGMLDGALKYGRTNFRAIGVRSSIYVDAAKRHVDAYFEGEDYDPDSGLPHLAHALACLAIIVDAEAAGKLTDDRQIRGGWRAWVDKLTPFVKMLKDKHADKHPKHYTIADNEVID